MRIDGPFIAKLDPSVDADPPVTQAPVDHSQNSADTLEPYTTDPYLEAMLGEQNSEAAPAQAAEGTTPAQAEPAERTLADIANDLKNAAGGSTEAFKQLVKEPSQKDLDKFKAAGGVPLMLAERGAELLGSDIQTDNPQLAERWKKANADWGKALGGDLEAYKRWKTTMTGDEVSIFEEWEFEDAGGLPVVALEGQFAVLGKDPPKEHLARMAALQKTVEAAQNGDPKALARVEAAFQMTPGTLTPEALKTPGMSNPASFLKSLEGRPADNTSMFGSADPNSKAGDPRTSSTNNAADVPRENTPMIDRHDVDTPPKPEKPETGMAAKSPTFMTPSPNGGLDCSFSDGSTKNYPDAAAAAADNPGYNFVPTYGTQTYTPEKKFGEDEPADDVPVDDEPEDDVPVDDVPVDDEPVDDEPEDDVPVEEDPDDYYINPDADTFAATDLSAAGKLKLEGGGVTDGRPELMNDAPLEFDPARTPYWGVIDKNPDADAGVMGTGGNTAPKITAQPETRPELQSDGPPDSPEGSDINPYAGKG